MPTLPSKLPMRTEFEEILEKARTYTAKYERSLVQLDRWMDKKDLTESERKTIAEQLQKEGFIDLRRFAESFMTEKMLIAHWGRSKVEQALRYNHRIPSNLIQEVWQEWQELEEYNEEEELMPLLERKYRYSRTGDRRKDYARLMNYAVGKGFSTATAHRLVFGLLKGTPDSQEE